MKRTFLFAGFAAAILLIFAGCSNPSSASNGSSDKSNDSVPSTVPENFSVQFPEVLEKSEEFVKKSLKANIPSRAALNPTEEDKWEGRINYQYGNWNVPSYFYGVVPGDNLVVNGEDLGTLQNLYHSKDENGNYRKATFVYKDKLYYVFDKSEYVRDDSYIVLGTADNVESIIFDQKDKTDTPEFSNFKFWIWERDLANVCYRTGDLGYAYTLRNVQMQDGSYATVTVAGYNYYNYGFRVWIKETDGKSVKKNYPNAAPYTFTSSYNIKTFAPVESGEDFIYEVVNNTNVNLTVQNYIRCWEISEFWVGMVAKTAEQTIAPGQTKQLKYKLSDLKALKPFETDRIGIGCTYKLEGSNSRPSGWENNFEQVNKKHTVTVTVDSEGYMNGENSWSNL